MCFFLHIDILFSSSRGSFLVLSALGHAGSPPEHHGASVGLAEVRGTCSRGSKSPLTTKRNFEHVDPSRAMQTQVQVRKMPTAHVISGILNVDNVVGHNSVMERYLPDTNFARHTTTFSTIQSP